jgi:hypothetical protein
LLIYLNWVGNSLHQQPNSVQAELGTVRDGADERKAAPPLLVAVPENTTTNGVAGSSAIDLPIERFADEGAQVIDNHKGSWSHATSRDFEAFLKLFVDNQSLAPAHYTAKPNVTDSGALRREVQRRRTAGGGWDNRGDIL